MNYLCTHKVTGQVVEISGSSLSSALDLNYNKIKNPDNYRIISLTRELRIYISDSELIPFIDLIHKKRGRMKILINNHLRKLARAAKTESGRYDLKKIADKFIEDDV